MFEAFYGFSADPFRLMPGNLGLFEHQGFSKARSYIDYALLRGEGFVMITGSPGMGKTTLIKSFQSRMADSDIRMAVVANARLEPEDLLRMAANAFGLDVGEQSSKAKVLLRLKEFFLSQRRAGGHALLVVDEAQDLSASALEELRLLTNLEHLDVALVQILLVGQESLRDLVRGEGMEQLHQRIVAAWQLTPLEPRETVGYVRHRLERAGWHGDPSFQPGVLRAIHEFSVGVPRLINLLCSRLLLRGFCLEAHELGITDVNCVIGELRDEGLAPRTHSAQGERFGGSPVGGPADAAGASASTVEAGVSADDAAADWSLLDQGLAMERPPAAQPVPASSTSVENELAAQVEPVSLAGAALDAEASVGEASRDQAHGHLGVFEDPDDASEAASMPLSELPESPPILVCEDSFRAESVDDWGDERIDSKAIAENYEPHRGAAGSKRRVIYALVALAIVGASMGGAYWFFPETWNRLAKSAEHWVETGVARLSQLSAWSRDATRVSPDGSAGPPPQAEEGLEVSPPVAQENISTVASNPPPAAAKDDADPIIDRPVQEDQPPLAPLNESPEPNSPAPDGVLAPYPSVVIGALNEANELGDQEGRFTDSAVGREEGRLAEPEPEQNTLDVDANAGVGGGVPEAVGGAVVETEEGAVRRPAPIGTLLFVEVSFQFNRSTIGVRFAKALDEVAALMDESSLATADIQGFTDSTGDPGYNAVLARRRAQAVADYLIKRGIDSERLSVNGNDVNAPGADASGADAAKERDAVGRTVEVRVLGPIDGARSD
ncbi:AAA family ATPase [Thiorhodococcus mannitoliphagus]|uniref:AAA family ATPase n=1 Tax=Thiorhodococcus mannitoliphagus TaxID=329406 RepID=A0A6P1DVS7_9GAMM|nr:AAA family ATPase [Thiorhodococcus mannitoliphagus]NEX19745.1 AAA family ATPase [Thiorhodococcus mannitoliphagus]